ncbi:MAG: PAS domain S-box protein, partial [Magnetococcales bacterium]|nr:PAS domain S-box protein [Magnetococcales bacterium]
PPQPVPFHGERSVPMRLALSGQSGSIIGLDYRGVEVLAAFEPVAILNMGVVAKIDMSELHSRFFKAGMLLLLLSLGVIVLGGVLFYRIARPLMRRTAEHQRLGRILETSINEIYVFDPVSWRFIYVNDGAKVNLGYTQEELSGMTPWDLKPRISEQAFRVLAQPLLMGEAPHLFFETVHRRKDGSLYPVDVRLQLFHNENPAVFVAIVMNVTAREEMERALQHAEANHFITLNSIGDAVISTDTEGRVRFMNPVAETLTGWSLEEARHHRIADVFTIINRVSRMPVPNPVENVLACGVVVGLANHTVLVAKDGTERQIADSGAPIRDETGTLQGVVLVFRDVTEDYRLRAAFQVSEERLNLALESTNDGVWDWNLRTGEAYLSPKVAQMLGLDPEALAPRIRSLENRLHPEDKERVRQGVIDHLEGRTAFYSQEYRLLSRAGGWVWVQGRGKVVERDASGRPLRMTGTHTDITARKQVEIELVRMNRALKALSSASEALVHALDEDQFLATVCKLIVEKAGYRLAWCGMAVDDADKSVRPVAQFGYEAGYLDTLRLGWGDNEFGRGPTGTAIRTGRPAHTRDILNDPNFAPWRAQAVQRGYRSSISLPLESDGRIFGALSVYAAEHDAFDEREAGFLLDLARNIAFGIRSLREHMNNRRLASAVEQTDDMVLVSDTSGLVQYVNQAFCRVSGYAPQEMIGQRTDLLGSGLFTSDPVRTMWDTLAAGNTWKGRFNSRKKDGSLFEVESSISPVKSPEGSVKHYVAVYRDITRQVQMERQLRQAQKMEAIGTLAGGIAHDFNNLLGIILGYTELVLEKLPENDQKHQDLQDVFQAGKRARDLVAQLLAFSRLTEGERKPIQVTPILKETIKFMRASLPTTIEIKLHIQDPEVTIQGDPTQLHQVIMNLCTNAALAMEENGGVLSVTLDGALLDLDDVIGLEISPGHYVVLGVRDTGVGIHPDLRGRLFDPFFTTREIGKGTGLGLSVVHGIVSEASGAVRVTSEMGRGSLFTVYWPMIREREPPLEKHALLARAATGYRVLFIDDEVGIARLGKMQLETLGYQVECFTNAHQGWARFQENPDRFDVIVTDQTMPGLTGIELLTRVRAMNARLPAILCSGKKDPVTPEQLQALGIREVLRKPILMEDMARVLHGIFSGRGPDGSPEGAGA